jgi:nitrite reductase/ring-hydroxylating ferredoxin subunit
MTQDGWADVAVPAEVPDGKPMRVMLDDVPVLVVRAGEGLFGIGDRCTHQGAELHRGVIKISGSVRTVTCPAHGSMFDLETGKVMRPPALKPVPVYDVKIEDGRVYVRPQADG